MERKQKAMWKESWEAVWAFRGSSTEGLHCFLSRYEAQLLGPSSPITRVPEDIIAPVLQVKS